VKSVLVAMHLVACQPDLLICEDMSVNAKRWADIETCRQDRALEMARLKQLICEDMSVNAKRWADIETCRQDRALEMAGLKQDLPDWAVVMSRCRYLIGRDARSTPAF